MRDPFRDNGPADRVMSFLSLPFSIGLLVTGVSLYRDGASPLWAVVAGILVLMACHGLYRRLRPDRGRA